MKQQGSIVWTLTFCGFIGAKLAGAGYVATWSWWWLLMPLVPWLGTLAHSLLQ